MKAQTSAATAKKPSVAVPPASTVVVRKKSVQQRDAAELVDRLADPPAFFCFAVHTHDWLVKPKEEQRGRPGRYGFYTVGHPENLTYSRLVQLGWTSASDSATEIVRAKTRTVKPEGFHISTTATTESHGITDEVAVRTGRQLADVLREFMDDLHSALTCKAVRIVAHHLEYNATVVEQELGRAGLIDERDRWVRLASCRGYCTMNPKLGRWLLMRNDDEVGDETKQHTKTFAATLDLIWGGYSKVKQPKYIPTGAKASMVHRVVATLVSRLHGARAASLEVTNGWRRPLPTIIASRLGKPKELIAVDIETHGWPMGTRKVCTGAFGWQLCDYELVSLLDFSRVVQIAWVVGHADPNAPREIKKSYYIRPTDFTITPEAHRKHKITQAFALEHGRPLAEALEKFMTDINPARLRWARLCAHHLEFDAGIILRELQRCVLPDEAAAWEALAHGGYCTMNADLGGWVLPRLTKEAQNEHVGKRFQSLTTMLEALKVDGSDTFLTHHHDAESDAEAAFLIYTAALKYAASSCHSAG
jgi:DNA polymerase III epsilon subunit-like protein